MTYSTDNKPALFGQAIGGVGQIWIYKSADVDSDVNGSDYFSDGDALGMKAGDIVFVIDTTTPKGSFHYVSTVTAGGAATVAFGAVA